MDVRNGLLLAIVVLAGCGAAPQAQETHDGPKPVVTVPEPIDNQSEIVIIVSNGTGAFKDHAQAVHIINDTHHCSRYFNESNWPEGTNVTCVENNGWRE